MSRTIPGTTPTWYGDKSPEQYDEWVRPRITPLTITVKDQTQYLTHKEFAEIHGRNVGTVIDADATFQIIGTPIALTLLADALYREARTVSHNAAGGNQ